jgi:hypothetical protein
MIFRIMLSLSMILVSLSRSHDDDKLKKALAEMNGTWTPTSAELDGE